MESAGFTDISITPTFFDKETVENAVKEVGDKIDLTTIPQDELYKTVYSAYHSQEVGVELLFPTKNSGL